jgi:hypothetical protein
MSEVIVRRPSAGTILGAIGAVAGLVALIVSLSANADAAANRKIQADEIAKGAVTARALRNGSVHSSAIAKSAVTAKKLKKGAVTEAALGNDAVTARILAPGSVYGGALGAISIRSTPIADLDQVAENGMWTAGNTEAVVCGPGEVLLGTGFAFTEPGNKEVTWLQAAPFLSGTGNGVAGRFASNSGGTAKGQVMAICLQ